MTGQGDHVSSQLIAGLLTQQLYTDVGAFFCNTRRDAQNICPVCTGPASMRSLCGPCQGAKETYGNNLADLVVPLAYAKARMPSMHQSAHHVWAYIPWPTSPGPCTACTTKQRRSP